MSTHLSLPRTILVLVVKVLRPENQPPNSGQTKTVPSPSGKPVSPLCLGLIREPRGPEGFQNLARPW